MSFKEVHLNSEVGFLHIHQIYFCRVKTYLSGVEKHTSKKYLNIDFIQPFSKCNFI